MFYTNIWNWLILIALVLLSAFFSASETAFASLNHIRIKNLAKKGNKTAAATQKVAENFQLLLATVLICNNIVNLSAATLSAMLFISMPMENGALISTVVITFVLLTFGEVLPKNYAKNHAEKTALAATAFLRFFIIALTPVSWFFVKIQRSPHGKNKEDPSRNRPSITEEELKVIIKEIKEEGVLEKQESELVQSALDFDETTVSDIITPRVDIVSISVDETADNIKDVFLGERYTRIPVYEQSKDNIIGILYQNDFFANYLNGNIYTIREIMASPHFVPPAAKISELLKDFQRKKTHMALVADQHGGIDGLVTLEDVLEELVGEIYDEDDEIHQDIKILDNGSYWVHGDMKLDDAFEYLKYSPTVQLEDQTIGAWVLDVFEKIPLEGDGFDFEDLSLKVDKMEEHRILSVTIRINQTAEKNGGKQ
ncbi:MAG: hemolysin family protein [Oscillospiraceae bacterium]|nr:hemolysin family protein [Oscillospiraceae bacterium]